jgi:hypothetical protein
MNKFSSKTSMMQVPVGFRFHPTDEELVAHYLHGKIASTSSCNRSEALEIIRDLDLYRLEPWDLHESCKIGEDEDSSSWSTKQTDWYFFSHKDRKYPTGNRANRATAAGFWKATGRDKPIHEAKLQQLIGQRKTLVFYKGRAPHGEKTDWIMHEFRLDGNLADMTAPCEDGSWVVCRVFRKTKNCKPKSDVDTRAGSMEPDQQAGAAVLLLPHQQGRVNSPAAEIQLSMSDGGGGQGAAAGVMCYLPAAYSHQNQQIQYLCNQEIINQQQQQLPDNYSRYHDEMGHQDPAAAAAAFPHLQQLAEIPKFEAAHHGYNMNSCNPSASSSNSFRSGQHELLQRQGKKAVDCSSSSNSYMPQFGASTGGELVRTADVESIDWMFEGAHGGAAAAAARDQAHLMNMRSIPSTSTGTCGTRRDHSLGDVTIHLQVMSRQLSSHVDQHFSSSNGLHHEVDDFWNFTDQK